MIFGKELRMFLDKGYEVIYFLLLGMKAALSVLGDNELVATDTASLTVQTDV